MNDGDDKVAHLGVKFKKPPDESKMLSIVPSYEGCRKHKYVIDAEADKVTCSRCDKTFNPMSVLVDLAGQESQWMMNAKRYQDEMARLKKRTRTKCQSCGEMTRISKR